MIEIIAQAVGFVGAVVNGISFQQKTRKRMISVQMWATASFIIHYILLGAFTGAALNGITLVRSFVFLNNDKKWARSRAWLYLFIIISIVSSLLTWVDWYSFLPAAAMVLSTISFWLKSEKAIRLVTFPSSPCWLAYNLISGSVAGVITECVVMTSIITAIIRYDVLKKDKIKNDC